MDTQNSANGLRDGLTPEKIRGYLDRRAKDVADIRGAVAQEDTPAARRTLREIAHRIKGNAALFGLPELGVMAGELVAEVDGGDWVSVTRSAVSMADRVETEKSQLR